MKTLSHAEAKRAGLPRYFTGRPCRRGHTVERIVSTRTCVDCHRAAQAKYREENPAAVSATEARRYTKHKAAQIAKAGKWQREHPEKCRAWAAEWALRNPERKRENNRVWRLANAEKVKADLVAWRAANPEHVRAKGLFYRNARRAALLHRTPGWADLTAIEQIYLDAREFREAGLAVDVDHIIPLQGEMVSGLHVPQNLRVCLSSVNRSKSNTYQTL